MSKIGPKIVGHYFPVKDGKMGQNRDISSLIDTLNINSEHGILIHMGLLRKVLTVI